MTQRLTPSSNTCWHIATLHRHWHPAHSGLINLPILHLTNNEAFLTASTLRRCLLPATVLPQTTSPLWAATLTSGARPPRPSTAASMGPSTGWNACATSSSSGFEPSGRLVSLHSYSTPGFVSAGKANP